MKYEVKVYNAGDVLVHTDRAESYSLDTQGVHTTLTLAHTGRKETVFVMNRSQYAVIREV
jgi:hypothetical protein